MGTILFAVINMAASSDLVAEDMTNLIISAMVRMGPLCLGIGSSSDRKMRTPEQLREQVLLRNLELEWPTITMLLAR